MGEDQYTTLYNIGISVLEIFYVICLVLFVFLAFFNKLINKIKDTKVPKNDLKDVKIDDVKVKIIYCTHCGYKFIKPDSDIINCGKCFRPIELSKNIINK